VFSRHYFSLARLLHYRRSIAESSARLVGVEKTRCLDPLPNCSPMHCAVKSPSGNCRSTRIYALEQRLHTLEPWGDNVLVQYLLEQVLHRRLCPLPPFGGVSAFNDAGVLARGKYMLEKMVKYECFRLVGRRFCTCTISDKKVAFPNTPGRSSIQSNAFLVGDLENRKLISLSS
jgi:hypothetical protein